MSEPVHGTREMIAGMSPVLREGLYAFVSTQTADAALVASAVASFREDEALSLIVPLERAAPFGDVSPMRWITLQVHSSLEGVGLTAAASTALADKGIAANIVAATHHDHIFVPARHAETALECLQELQAKAQST